MHVYFVRHGETELSRSSIHQSPSTPLSPRGREEAVTAGEYLRSVNADILLSSEYTRALETARIIGSYVGLTPKVQGLFYEVVRPSSLYHSSHFSPRTLWYMFLSFIHRKNPLWRYEDAENASDIVKRARKALEYLESFSGQNGSIIIVSHTVFINIMVSYMCRNRLLAVRDLVRTALHIERMKHGGIVHLEYVKGGPNTCRWRLVNADPHA